MCGIAGMVGAACPYDTAQKMLATMQRRGPDQKGIWQKDDVTLIHARLAVIDLAHGLQPMEWSEAERTCTIVYNGEIYNTPELRRILLEHGHRLKTQSDTEIVLHSYLEWGEDCVLHLNGIFAFAIWDSACHSLFVARDRIGVKPFFFTERNQQFFFASEIKTLLCYPDIAPRINADSIFELMLIGPGRTPGYGVFKDIQELRPGWCGWYDKKRGFAQKQYWKLIDQPHTDSLEQTIATVRELVYDSVRRQLVSDVPLCTFLSGGLDSSILSAIAAQEYRKRGKKLHTVSVTYRDNRKYFQATHFQPNTDDDFIARMNDAIGAENHLITIDTPQLVEALFEAVEARDLPGMADVDSSLLLFCREIKKLGTVALSGECADEIFGGYPWYRDADVRRRAGFPWAQSTAYRAEFLRDEWKQYRDPLQYVDQKYQETVAQVQPIAHDTPDDRRIREMTQLNFQWFMQTLLDRKDRMSMYSGLEVRVPFCDHRIAEYLYHVPWQWKDLNGVEKGLLREAAQGWLPDEVRLRKKSPYPKTHNPAYLKAVSELLRQIIGEGTSPIFDIVKRDRLEQLLTDSRAQPWYGQLMTTPQTIAYFLQLHHWMKTYHVVIG
ncbi:MAG: asparagine synthase (glutamine-hydrolyzing) [Eubacteriales bacterium]|nr:asparagine synthase (glutamine-hydrolyzing) [Eubacteriales bacterium]